MALTTKSKKALTKKEHHNKTIVFHFPTKMMMKTHFSTKVMTKMKASVTTLMTMMQPMTAVMQASAMVTSTKKTARPVMTIVMTSSLPHYVSASLLKMSATMRMRKTKKMKMRIPHQFQWAGAIVKGGKVSECHTQNLCSCRLRSRS